MFDELSFHGLGTWLLRAVLLRELESMAAWSIIGSLSFTVTEIPALVSGYCSLRFCFLELSEWSTGPLHHSLVRFIPAARCGSELEAWLST